MGHRGSLDRLRKACRSIRGDEEVGLSQITVIPAKAGIPLLFLATCAADEGSWTPAFAGATVV
ncbi:MAG: hypothetical protein BVN33_11040 [Proteobacteria bacterium ST_bin13]|nr:MAG: hypothetical protein BVN33_11040 [Proteobacteria bacterium ST_bin13]